MPYFLKTWVSQYCLEEKHRELLKKHHDLLEKYTPTLILYAEMTACEWQYIYHDIPEFPRLNEIVSNIYELSYEVADDEFDVSHYLSVATLEGIKGFLVSGICDPEL